MGKTKKEKYEEYIDMKKRYSEVDPEVLAKKLYLKGIKYQSGPGSPAARAVRLDELKFAKEQFPWVKSILVFIVGLFLIIGPGLGVITSLLSSLNPVMWIILIVLLIAVWRNK
jgi:hypothetical protein